MQLGLIGLGRMGSNMARRLVAGGHKVVAWDHNADAIQATARDGAVAARSLDDLVSRLTPPRSIWIMVPAGDATEQTVTAVAERLQRGDAVIDGGNTHFKDDIRRARGLTPRGIAYLDVGTSGGVWGAERGYCLMIGGPAEVVTRLTPVFRTLAPGQGSVPPTPGLDTAQTTAHEGFLHCGPAGAGHFVKMIHNGIEYGMMQAYAEGFALMQRKEVFGLDLHQVAELWRHGSVVRSWLLDLTARALADNPTLKGIAAYVTDSGEGRWTVMESIELEVAIPVITLALERRFRSRETEPFGDRLLAALRQQFGGHAVKATS